MCGRPGNVDVFSRKYFKNANAMRQMKFLCQLKLAYLEYGIIVLVILDMLNSVFDKDEFNMNNILER